jgi:hypothetical protein
MGRFTAPSTLGSSSQTTSEGDGRVPQVRQGVPGPKKTERSSTIALRFFPQAPLMDRLKAFEKNMFGPGTLMRTWGTRRSWSNASSPPCPSQLA